MIYRHPPLSLYLILIVITGCLNAQEWTIGRLNLSGIGEAGSIAYGKGRFVVSFTPSGTGASTAYSTDGVTWTKSSTSYNGPGGTVAFVGDMFYYVSGNTVYQSVDGDEWTSIQTIPGGAFVSASGVATDGTALMYGSNSLQFLSPIYSPNHTNWAHGPSLPVVANTDSVLIRRPAYGAGRFVVTYSNSANNGANIYDKMASTPDGGQTWQEIPTTNYFRSIAFGNERFLGLGRGGAGNVVMSTDGLNFSSISSTGLSNNASQITFTGGRFIAQYQDAFYDSHDGGGWTPLGNLPSDFGISVWHAVYGAGKLVVFGTRVQFDPFRREDFILTMPRTASPIIAEQPSAVSATIGGSANFSVRADNPDGISYQWYKASAPISGANTATLSLSNIAITDAGSYHCRLTNAMGSVDTAPAVLTVTENPGRLVNLSVLTLAGADDDTLTAGFVLRGTGDKNMLVRGIGPELATYGVQNLVEDPALGLFQSSTKLHENDDWSGYIGVDIGAFQLPAGSKDAAIMQPLSQGSYTAQITHPSNALGNALIEVYDTDTDNIDLLLVNLAARVNLPTNGSLTAGFVITGNTSLEVLIRAVGPALSPYLDTYLKDPVLVLYRNQDAITENDNWSGDYGEALGAFPLEEGSADSVIKATLAPGNYSVRVRSADPNIAGVVLVEVYADQ